MKPKTKKILIITFALALVAVIIWVVTRKAKKGTAEGYIDRINTTAANRRAIKGYLERARMEQDIDQNATDNGVSYEKALALSAAYYLVQDGTIPLMTWYDWKNQVKAME